MKSILKISILTIFQSFGFFLIVLFLFFFAGKLIWLTFFRPFQEGIFSILTALLMICISLLFCIALFGVLLAGLNRWYWDKQYLYVYYLGFLKKKYPLSNLKYHYLENVSGSREHNTKAYQVIHLCFEDQQNKKKVLSFASKDFKNFNFLVEQIQFLAIPEDKNLYSQFSSAYLILLGIIVFILVSWAIIKKIIEWI